jgi:hypothetical protein
MRLASWLQLLFSSIFLLTTGCTYTGKDNNLSGNAAGTLIGGAAGRCRQQPPSVPPARWSLEQVLAGMALGYYMSTLRFDAGPIFKAGGDVYTQGEYVGISIPSYKLFEPNSAEFTPQAEPCLIALLQF